MRFLRQHARTIVYPIGGDPPTHGPHRLHLGAIAFDLWRDGAVRLVRPVEGLAPEYESLRALLRAAKGGA